MRSRFSSAFAAALLAGVALHAPAQISLAQPSPPSPLTDPAVAPDTALLFSLEAQFAAEVAKGGGAAYAKWFADDALTLQNGKAPVTGKTALAASANWDPEQYKLTWHPDGGRMSPAGDMGFTWGPYQGNYRDKSGNWQAETGRYITVWKKTADGGWKVALDASNDGPPDAGACCSIH